MNVVATRNFGAPIRRNEDARLLSGQALFVDDVELPGMLHAAFLRSNLAHARIRTIDVSAARAREGIVAVYTAEDLGDYWAPGPLLVPPPPIADTVFHPRTQVPLAKDKVRHVGEPLAVVLAQSRYLAEDALSDIAVTSKAIEHFNRLGIGIALDDFGTGYSSFSYLMHLHPRIIKIDQSFVRPRHPSARNDALLETIISLGSKLGLTVVAEGIETEAQLERLRSFGCELGQGFLFSHAVAASDAAELLAAQRASHAVLAP